MISVTQLQQNRPVFHSACPTGAERPIQANSCEYRRILPMNEAIDKPSIPLYIIVAKTPCEVWNWQTRLDSGS